MGLKSGSAVGEKTRRDSATGIEKQLQIQNARL